jgi:hypothetical protein
MICTYLKLPHSQVLERFIWSVNCFVPFSNNELIRVTGNGVLQEMRVRRARLKAWEEGVPNEMEGWKKLLTFGALGWVKSSQIWGKMGSTSPVTRHESEKSSVEGSGRRSAK